MRLADSVNGSPWWPVGLILWKWTLWGLLTCNSFHFIDLINGLLRQKTYLWGFRITKVQTSLHIRAVWSAPLSIAYWEVPYLDLPLVTLQFLASLCSWAYWFESHFAGNPEDKFSRDDPQISQFLKKSKSCFFCMPSTRIQIRLCSLTVWLVSSMLAAMPREYNIYTFWTPDMDFHCFYIYEKILSVTSLQC